MIGQLRVGCGLLVFLSILSLMSCRRLYAASKEDAKTKILPRRRASLPISMTTTPVTLTTSWRRRASSMLTCRRSSFDQSALSTTNGWPHTVSSTWNKIQGVPEKIAQSLPCYYFWTVCPRIAMFTSKCTAETAVNWPIENICLVDKYSLLIGWK